MNLAKQWKIHLDLHGIVEWNHFTILLGHSIMSCYMLHLKHWGHTPKLFKVNQLSKSKHKCHTKPPFFTFALIMNQCQIVKVEHWWLKENLAKSKCLIHNLTFPRGNDMSKIPIDIWKRKEKKEAQKKTSDCTCRWLLNTKTHHPYHLGRILPSRFLQ